MKPSKRFFPTSKDFRTPYARDRDRILHCSSFRRLEYKTQVFLNHEGDYFRTRLTHSLEVSQIARTICGALKLNETLAEAIALAHDLGHTPFGHIGGDALDELLKKDGRTMGFEHNFQSFRVLTKLEKRYAKFDGLNLTFATLEGVLKHSYPYKKPFLKEIDNAFDLEKHPSLEAMVVDISDEIAYTCADIDDGIKYKLISFEDILQHPLCEKVNKTLEKEKISQENPLYRHRFVTGLITILVKDFILNAKTNAKKYRQKRPICQLLDASTPLPLTFSKEYATQLKQLKKILFQKLYTHEKIVQKMYAGKIAIEGLYNAFNDEVKMLPLTQKEFLETRVKERVIADYIASMTDRYAFKIYQEIYGYKV